MKNVWLTSADKLVTFLEWYIPIYGNPATPDEWDKCLQMMAEKDQAESLGQTEMSAGYIAGSLRDEGFNAKQLKRDQK